MTNLNYQDRGRLKYQGFYLSDHTEKIARETAKEHKNAAKPLMVSSKIEEILATAVLKRKMVAIQLEAVDLDGNYFEDIIGFIQGSDELGIYVNSQKIHYDEIRNVMLYNSLKWSQLEN